MHGWYLPLDSECPIVQKWNDMFWNDPITQACGCSDEINEAWENKHRAECERCQEYGVANIEVA